MKIKALILCLALVLLLNGCANVKDTTIVEATLISCNIETITTINTVGNITYPTFIDGYYATFDLNGEVVKCSITSEEYSYLNTNIDKNIKIMLNKITYEGGRIEYYVNDDTIKQ